jgi:hypothetical protein
MSIEIDITQVPKDKQSDSRFVCLFDAVQKKLSDPKTVEEICLHEGAHYFYYVLSGAKNLKVAGPQLTYDPKHDGFDYTNGSVQAISWNDEFKKLPTTQQLHRMAIICAAGEIVTTIILSVGAGSGTTDQQHYIDLCRDAKLPYSQWANIWRAAEEKIRNDLQNPDVRRAICAAAKEVEPLLFKSI